MDKYILAVDQGTTSSRAILFDNKGEVKKVAQKEFKQFYPQAGWVEHDPMEILSTQIKVMQDIVAEGYESSQIEAIGITNQRETVVVFDRHTGKPIYPAIVWQCRRTSAYCKKLKEKGLEDKVRAKTGLVLDPYFSASKITWILDNVEGAREKAKAGELLFGTIDTWLIYNFSDKKDHITDPSNASRTMLYNINEDKWDKELFEIFDIPMSMAPKVVASSGSLSFCSNVFSNKIPISGIAGDQQAALMGQGCFNKGSMKSTYGTGCFLLCNTGDKPILSKHKLLTTVAWKIGDHNAYCLEGSVFMGGAIIQWVRDELQLIKDAKESESLAREVEDTNGVFVAPAFAGLGAPHWDSEARGAILGLTRGANRKHIVRACLESIALQVNDVINCMRDDMQISLDSLRVDGGACENKFLMQFQSDVMNGNIVVPQFFELTALGATFLAGLGVGFWKDLEQLPVPAESASFQVQKDEDWRIELIRGWQQAISRVKSL